MMDFFTDTRKTNLQEEVICFEIENLFIIFNYILIKQSWLFIFAHFKVIFTSFFYCFKDLSESMFNENFFLNTSDENINVLNK